MDVEQFRKISQERKSNNLTVDQICHKHKLAPHQFYYWQKKYSTNLPLPTESGFVELRPNIEDNTLIELKFSGFSINIDLNMDPQKIKSLIRIFKSC